MTIGTWERNTFFFQNSNCYTFYWHFLITLVNCGFRVSFSPINVMFCLNWRLLKISKTSFFTVKGLLFPFVLQLIIITIHGMRPIILGYFFPNNFDGNKYISFWDLHDPRGGGFQNFRLIFIGPMKGEWWILI